MREQLETSLSRLDVDEDGEHAAVIALARRIADDIDANKARAHIAAPQILACLTTLGLKVREVEEGDDELAAFDYKPGLHSVQ